MVLITTKPHREGIEARIAADGFNVRQLTGEGRLIFFDAETLLCQFMDGMPDGLALGRILVGSSECACLAKWSTC